MHVRKASGGLLADVMNRTLRLIPRADGALAVKYRFLGLFPVRVEALDGVGVFRADIAGREVLAARKHGRAFPIGERIRPVPLSAEWLGRAGSTRSSIRERMPSYRKRYDSAKTAVSCSSISPFRCSSRHGELRDRSRFKIGGGTLRIGRGMGETVRVLTVNGEEMFAYSGYLLKKKAE